MKKVIIVFIAKSGSNDKSLISIAQIPHHISRAVAVIDTLKNHLLPCYIICLFYEFRKYEYTFTLKLCKRFVYNFFCKICYPSKSLLCIWLIVLNFHYLHQDHRHLDSYSRMPRQIPS